MGLPGENHRDAKAPMPLKVLPSTPKIRPSRASRWRLGVLLLVHVLIALHIAHWLTSGHTVSPVEPSEAAALAHQGIINTGLIFFAATILLTAVFGRFFCGWACHLVALQDASAWLLGKLGRRPKPLKSRALRFVSLAVALVAFVWPLVYRLWLERGLPPLRLELTTSDFWATFPGWIVGGLTFVICGGAIIYFLGAKGFCTYACPYGAFFAAAERLSPMRIRVTDACQGCGHCTAVCTSNVRVHEEVRDFGMVVDDGCMKCLDCVSVCPNDALYYGPGPLPGKSSRRAARWRRPDLTWREEAVLVVAFIVAFLTVRGLYGQVPMLMGLGLAAIMAYFTLLGFQLLTRPHLKLKGWRLKRQGEWLPAGRWLAVGLVVMGLLWGHSAVIRYHSVQGALAYRASRALQPQVLDPMGSPPQLSGEQERRFSAGVDHQQKVFDLGLLPSVGVAARQATLLALLGRDDEVEPFALAAIGEGDLVSEMHLLLGRRSLANGHLEVASEQFSRALDAGPRRAEPYLGLGIALARQGDVAAAAETFERGVQAAPYAVSLAYNGAVAQATLGDMERAVALFEHTLAMEPAHLPARENLAGLLADLGRLQESATHYQQLLSRPGADPRVRDAYERVLQALESGTATPPPATND